ncbi:hypothetical protein MMC09_005495 [Bachmanniomyces sp. S44760]|nr:hypothetical protein [Bachmanniomyces sp. S44760]
MLTDYDLARVSILPVRTRSARWPYDFDTNGDPYLKRPNCGLASCTFKDRNLYNNTYKRGYLLQGDVSALAHGIRTHNLEYRSSSGRAYESAFNKETITASRKKTYEMMTPFMKSADDVIRSLSKTKRKNKQDHTLSKKIRIDAASDIDMTDLTSSPTPLKHTYKELKTSEIRALLQSSPAPGSSPLWN